MLELIRLRPRGKQVLNALYEHGPLSTSTLKEILSPTITTRRLNEITKRLYDVGLVINRHSSVPTNAGRYLELSTSKPAKQFLSDILNVSQEMLSRVPGGTNELEHWQECAIWVTRFKNLFPKSTLIRDFQISSDQKALNTLLMEARDIDLLPDLLLRMPKLDDKGYITVAIEIERTKKSRFRLAQKLRKFSTQTKLDGVVYICRNESIAASLRNVYLDRIIPKALRVKHYGLNFLTFSNGELVTGTNEPMTFNSELKSISFNRWLHFLRSTDLEKRRDCNVN